MHVAVRQVQPEQDSNNRSKIITTLRKDLETDL